ncbi:hypothetical protein J7889_01235 [Mycoplasmopsis agalactiae]|nr:hypothetical protein [Mycoplasmopsis agalactiae]MCE6056230.1 hypothetical protein [Mycoplasmopsis agalactiae]
MHIKLLVPNNKILMDYHNITRPIFIKITENICENRKLNELKNKLHPLLMNGQVTIED